MNGKRSAKVRKWITVLSIVMVATLAYADKDTGVGENGVALESSPSFEQEGVPVDMFNIVRAETAKYFAEETILSGGNRMRHERTGIDLKNQTVIRSNFDMIYSYGVFDASGGLVVTVPKYDLYHIVQIFDENHITLDVVYPGETAKISKDDLTYGDHVYLFMRTQRRSMDEKGLKELNARQDSVVIKQGSSKPYVSEVKYDPDTFNTLRKHLIGPYGIKTAIIDQGFVENIEDIVFPHYQMVNIGGWAGLPAKHAFYFVVVPGDEKARNGESSSMTFNPPPLQYEKNGFWSLTIYDEQGWVVTDKFNMNSMKAKPNKDGSFTIHLNTPGAINNIEVKENWNALFRCYLPKSVDEVLDFKASVIKALPKEKK
jgi:hypothetical protein